MWSQTEKNDFLYEQNRLRCWIEGQGAVLCRLTPEERETARECLKAVSYTHLTLPTIA